MLNRNFKQVLLCFFALVGTNSFAQVKIGDNPTTINPSSALEIESTTRGILTPRMTAAQRTAIVSPANGLLVYQTDATAGFYYYNGTAWTFIGSAKFVDGTNPLHAVYTTGNVGIGTVAPDERLTIGSASPVPIALSINNTIGNFRIGMSTTNGHYGLARSGDVSIQTKTNNGIALGIADIPVMYISNSRNLGIGINNQNPNASAEVDINSTTRGFLPPRMNAAQMSLIVNPAEGLVVYCTNCLPIKGLRIFDGVNWVNMSGTSVAPAAFTFTGNYYFLPNFIPGKVMGADNTLYLEINATSTGVITFSSTTANGYSFSGRFEVVNTGIQFVQVIPTGTQTAFSASGDNFTITGAGTTTQTQSVTIMHSQLGSSFTTLSNGSQNFSDNTACQTKVLSTTAAADCPATVTVGANTYNTAFINGQCWFKENLNEVATLPCASAINTGCNIWLNTTPGDIGSWGYYNNTSTSGSAGWRTTVPAANEGLLYQWSAAMGNSEIERSRGVCPAGWHIPSDCEWKYLEHGLGMSISDQNLTSGFSASGDVGGKLATFTRLNATSANGTGSNSTGFSALAAGQRAPAGNFLLRTTTAYFWTSTAINPTQAMSRTLDAAQSGVRRLIQSKGVGYSVRCLKN